MVGSRSPFLVAMRRRLTVTRAIRARARSRLSPHAEALRDFPRYLDAREDLEELAENPLRRLLVAGREVEGEEPPDVRVAREPGGGEGGEVSGRARALRVF